MLFDFSIGETVAFEGFNSIIICPEQSVTSTIGCRCKLGKIILVISVD
jgi:hypothetical protein